MQLEFVPIEEFYFALTLAMRTLEDLGDEILVEKVRSQLVSKCGRPSTVAAAQQNNYNYVFRVPDYDNSPSTQLLISVADWQGKLRLSSDYGWTLDQDRKPIRTPKFSERQHFAQELRAHLSAWLEVSFPEAG